MGFLTYLLEMMRRTCSLRSSRCLAGSHRLDYQRSLTNFRSLDEGIALDFGLTLPMTSIRSRRQCLITLDAKR
jgi:hypothetical protein